MFKDAKRKKLIITCVALAAVLAVIVLVWTDYRSFVRGFKGSRYGGILDGARKESVDAIPAHFKGVHRLFNTADRKIPAFVVEVTGLKAKTYWATHSKDEFRKWLEAKFSEMVMTPTELKAEYVSAKSSFCHKEGDIELELIDRLEKGMPYLEPVKFKTLETKFSQQLLEKKVSDEITGELRKQLVIEMGCLIPVLPLDFIYALILSPVIDKIGDTLFGAGDKMTKDMQVNLRKLQLQLNKASIKTMTVITVERAKERDIAVDAFLAENVGLGDYLKYRFTLKSNKGAK